MVLTLFFSKKSQHVTETELSLASQHEGDERFGSTLISRSLVRATLVMNTMWTGLIPARVQKAIDRRFEPLPAEERSSAPYDMVRAVVNLTAASILIAIATSYKLPLSTTYVVFMVAMGSSLADRSWGRESAVYRITGVMAVISGWFITALGGFLIAFVVGLALIYGGMPVFIVITLLCGWMLVHSNFLKKNKESNIYKIGKFTFDTQKQILATAEKQTKLTTKESELLGLLCAHANEILQRDFALKTIWIDDNYFNARSMDVYITKLRKHLKEDDSIEIINIHGKGYKLITPEAES